jgi:hypothetical protein
MLIKLLQRKMTLELQEMFSLLAKINIIMPRRKECIVQNICCIQHIEYLDNFHNLFVSFILYTHTHTLKAFEIYLVFILFKLYYVVALTRTAVPKTRPLEMMTPYENFVLNEQSLNLKKVSSVIRKSGLGFSFIRPHKSFI